MEFSKFISYLFHSRTQTHIFHLQTPSYAEHIALQAYYEGIIPLIDALVESYQGKNGIIHDYTNFNLKQYQSKEQVIGYFETLCAQYPEFAEAILGKNNYQPGSPYITMVRYHDKDQDLIYLPERKNLTLVRTPNQLGKCMVVAAQRPSLDGQARGQYDDVLAVQLARARFAILQIQAAEKSIQAPIAIPQDVQELALGPDSIMRSSQPQNIRRVGLDLPPGVFTESGVLERELRLGARYPETRSGNTSASVITGRGVQELQAGFDTQIKSAQAQFARMFSDLIGLKWVF